MSQSEYLLKYHPQDWCRKNNKQHTHIHTHSHTFDETFVQRLRLLYGQQKDKKRWTNDGNPLSFDCNARIMLKYSANKKSWRWIVLVYCYGCLCCCRCRCCLSISTGHGGSFIVRSFVLDVPFCVYLFLRKCVFAALLFGYCFCFVLARVLCTVMHIIFIFTLR